MKLPAITFKKEAFSTLGKLLEKEWLITNGLGGYASQTLPGLNTRKYHGLLVAALDPPGNRNVCLAKLDEDVLVGDHIFRLGSNEFLDAIYPEGYKLISQVTLNPTPTYDYDLRSVQVKKTVFMPYKTNTTTIIYKAKNQNRTNIRIRLYPLLTCRYYHTVISQVKVPLNFTQQNTQKQLIVSLQRPTQATLVCQTTDGEFTNATNWVNHLLYRDEQMRGESDIDDCFQPGYFEMVIPANNEKQWAVTCSISRDGSKAQEAANSFGGTLEAVRKTFNLDLDRKTQILLDFYIDRPSVPMTDWLNWILLAADSFIVESDAGKKAVIAGYHWFESWGRDTFVSLPGLLLVTGKYDQAKNILQIYAAYCKSGLIPNFISDKLGIPVYNTVDATLWYINSVLQYVKYTGDYAFVKDMLWEKLQEVIENHQRGTLFGIRQDSDGLLMHGPRLTWMDAAIGNDIITPRTGKAVEIQALWYNAIRAMQMLATRFDETKLAQQYSATAEQARRSFNLKFWNQKSGCLYDVIHDDAFDESIRPNQILAVSLDFEILDKERNPSVVDVVNSELVTPYGLRTLSLGDPKFIGKCSGDSLSRDRAYHNGTIWPWLLGPYVTAYLKVNDYSLKAREQMLENLILPLFSVGIHQSGLGTINEIYDCDPPNEPRGCISQAWSVAEPLRAYVEDILQIKPKNMQNFGI